MLKILLIGPNFHYFNQSIERGLRANGCEVEIEEYDDPIHPYNALNKVRYKLAKDKENLKQQSRKAWKQYIEARWEDTKPDIVLIVNGSNLLPKSVELFKTKSKVVFWMFDSITHFTYSLNILKYADKVFCYEKGDIPILKDKLSSEAEFLSQAVDTNLYFPLKSEKKYDIVFAGNIYQSKKRQRLLNAVIEAFPDKKICFYGLTTPWYKSLWKWLTRKNRDIFTNRNGSAETLNKLYNESKVVLNIHHEQQTDGANPKVYEIAATGAYEICDRNAYIESLFPNGEIALYSNEKELIACITHALQSNELNGKDGLNGNEAMGIVRKSHSFEVRMKEMLDKL
ncbi:MAG: glycosyltransferase [Bacteroidales bacterium]|nr:glycosyltransferase [Bacteroidales bacterium]